MKSLKSIISDGTLELNSNKKVKLHFKKITKTQVQKNSCIEKQPISLGIDYVSADNGCSKTVTTKSHVPEIAMVS